MKSFLVFLLLLAFSGFNVRAQDPYRDSLYKVLLATQNDTNYIKILDLYVFNLPYSNPDSGIVYADSILKLSDKADYDYGRMIGYQLMGESFYFKGEYIQSLLYYNKVYEMEMMMGIHELRDRLGEGRIYVELGDTATGLPIVRESWRSMNNMGDSIMYRRTNRVGPTLSDKIINDVIYSSILLTAGQLDSALYYSLKAYDTERKFRKQNWAVHNYNLGTIYRRKGDFRMALHYYNLPIDVYSSPSDVVDIYLGKAEVFKRMNLMDSCFYFADTAYKIAAASNFVKKTISAAELLGWYYRDSSPSKSLEYFNLVNTFKDSLYEMEKYSQLNGFKLADKLRKAEIEASHEAASNRSKVGILIGIIIITFLIGYFLWRSGRHRKLANELLKAEKEISDFKHQKEINEITFTALRSQMNPHFIFNALNTIQNYVYTNDKKSATNYLGKFSELIRKMLDTSKQDLITLDEEIHLLRLYLDIERARFGDSLNTLIDVDPALNTKNIFIPSMLIQPYTENAIKHGLMHLNGMKNVAISFSSSDKNQYISIIIDDNGIGRKKSMEINKFRLGHHSFANKANEKRIELINKINSRKTKLEIIDKMNEDGTPAGTTVIIKLPILN